MCLNTSKFNIYIKFNTLKKLIYFYDNQPLEIAKFLILEKIYDGYLIKKIEDIPTNACISNANFTRIDPKYIKYTFKKYLLEKNFLILIHNHPKCENSSFSKSDLSLIDSYYKFWKTLGCNKNIFGGAIIDNTSIKFITIEDDIIKNTTLSII